MTTTLVAPTARHRKIEPGRARRRPLRVLSGLLLALGAVAAVGSAVLVVLLHIGFAPVLSPSMQPGFAPGDLLITRQIPASEVRVGDVVVLPRPDAPGQRYAHRIISVRTENGLPVVRTKGDANAAPDPQALRIESASVPEVIGHVPWIGRVALLGQRLWIRLALIALIGISVLIAAKRLLWRGAW